MAGQVALSTRLVALQAATALANAHPEHKDI
jgi:hypothetical protein